MMKVKNQVSELRDSRSQIKPNHFELETTLCNQRLSKIYVKLS